MKMADPMQSAEQAGLLALLLAKLLPAGVGVAIVAAVDKPETRREMALRFFVGLSFSALFTEAAIDGLRTFAWFAFLNPNKVGHIVAVAGVLGAIGWSVVGGAAIYLRRLRADPGAVLRDGKELLK